MWYRPDAERMRTKDWQHFVRALSCRIREKTGNLFFIFNGHEGNISWQLPVNSAHKKWQLVLSTEKAALLNGCVQVSGWAVVVLKEVGT